MNIVSIAYKIICSSQSVLEIFPFFFCFGNILKSKLSLHIDINFKE